MNRTGLTLWFTGLSGAGKTTISRGVEQELRRRGCLVEVLDGDEIRCYLSQGLGFSREDRDINIRRIGYVASLLNRNRVIAIVAAISPFQTARNEVRQMGGNFIEVYVKASFQICENRDVKGLYAKARNGEIKNFTGLDSPYEEPLNPEIICNTEQETVQESIAKVINFLESQNYIKTSGQDRRSRRPIPWFSSRISS